MSWPPAPRRINQPRKLKFPGRVMSLPMAWLKMEPTALLGVMLLSGESRNVLLPGRIASAPWEQIENK